MKCMSRSTFGIIIGGINIFGYTLTIFYILKVLCELSELTEEQKENTEDILTSSIVILYIVLVICVFGIIVSGLLIAGIIKRRHLLMKPWIYSSAASIVCEAFLVVICFIVGLVHGQAAANVFASFIFGCLTLALQVLILYFIYKLYKEIRQ